MKRIRIWLLCLGVILALGGCGIYQKAQQEYDRGNYAEAKSLFAKMKNTDTVEEWIKKCDYRMALELLEGKEYDKAIESFKELGSFDDSEMQLKRAKWLRMKAFIEETGEVHDWTEGFKSIGGGVQVNALSPVVFTLYFPDEGTAVISIDGITIDTTNGSTMTQNIHGKTKIKIDSSRAEITYNDKVRFKAKNGGTMEVTEDYAAHADIKGFSDIHDIFIDVFTQSGTDITGKRISSGNPNDAYMAQPFLTMQELAIKSVKDFFKKADFVFSMSDLGFADLD